MGYLLYTHFNLIVLMEKLIAAIIEFQHRNFTPWSSRGCPQIEYFSVNFIYKGLTWVVASRVAPTQIHKYHEVVISLCLHSRTNSLHLLDLILCPCLHTVLRAAHTPASLLTSSKRKLSESFSIRKYLVNVIMKIEREREDRWGWRRERDLPCMT